MTELFSHRSSIPTLNDLDGPATRQVAMVDAKPRDRGVLIQMSGLEAGRLHGLHEQVTTLGRGRTCSIRFDDASLSRVHAIIVRDGARFVLEDHQSLNGSFVNERRIDVAQLKDGDRVRLASGAQMRFQIVDEDEQHTLERLYDSSVYDGLTGVFNRKQLETRLVAEVAYALRHKTELSIVMIDLDHFKRINDTLGHLAGDAVLKFAANMFSSMIRVEDVIARYGGEEFVVIARGVPLVGAAMLAERLRGAIEAKGPRFDGEHVRVTSSAGVASLRCCEEKTVHALLARADERLYRAKAGGRNQVVAT